jgi:hypothetical protein
MGNAYRLETYSRTNKYHQVNDRQIAIKDLWICIYCSDDDVYSIEFYHHDNLINDYSYVIANLSFEIVWKIIKPYGNTPTDYIIENKPYCTRFERWHYRPLFNAEIAIRKTRIDKLKALIDNKLHESETNFKQKLLLSLEQIDCKIDFL